MESYTAYIKGKDLLDKTKKINLKYVFVLKIEMKNVIDIYLFSQKFTLQNCQNGEGLCLYM